MTPEQAADIEREARDMEDASRTTRVGAIGTRSQNDRVLRMLMDDWAEGITSIQAIYSLGVTRLAARISDLRKEGHVIESTMVTVKDREGKPTRVARYRLVA